MEFLVVSGLSGAGKSTVMSIFEDIGYFCVDNLPPALIPKFAEMCMGGSGTYERVAMVCDIRGGTTFDTLFEALDSLRAMEFEYKILFVEANDQTIIKRYKETRRSHPLMTDGISLTKAVERERQAMEPVRQRANYVITTTDLPTKKLRAEVLELFLPQHKKGNEMSISVMSFGFKYGVPMEADLMFDVRFLPNPFYVETLREKTGLDAAVRDFVFQYGSTTAFMEHLKSMISFLVPQYMEEGKSALVIAIGCTGGHHRSVAVAHVLTQYIRELGYNASETHRDMTRG